MYFTVDGRFAIVVPSGCRSSTSATRSDEAAPHGQHAVRASTTGLRRDGPYALVSCEFSGQMLKLDVARQRIVKTITLRAGSMPQDVNSRLTGACSTCGHGPQRAST